MLSRVKLKLLLIRVTSEKVRGASSSWPSAMWALNEAARQAKLWQDSFGFADSIPLTTDAIRAPVQWRTQADLSTLRDKTVRIALRLRGPAIVYALAIHDDHR